MDTAELRVLCFTNMYPTDANPSMGSFVRQLVEDVRTLGVHVEVLAFDGTRRRRRYAEAVLMLRRTLRDGHFDLVHAHYGLTGMIALTQRRVPTLVTFHGSDTGNVRWQAWVSWVVARRATPMFVSRDGAERLGCPDAAVVPAGVNIDLFRPRTVRDARRALGWPDHGRFILLPGARANPTKNAILFDAVMDELRRRVPSLTAVSLEGFSREQVVDVMNAVDVMLMTSVFEGSPVAPKESLACMTPVVSVAVGDMADQLAGLPGCTIAPRVPAVLADAVLAAFECKGDQALRRRAEELSSTRMAERVIGVYQTMLGG